MEIKFHFEEPASLTHRSQLKDFISKIFKREGRRLHSLNYIFCSDESLLKINSDFLQHDYYTDIITFDLSPPGSKEIEAEIYISVDRVKDNAQQFKSSLKEELHRVIFHGVLHLCGYKDKGPKAEKLMRAKEAKYLALYFS
ncbi:MAG: rRNA maturation RNase YbeY [Ferruginibacter sp.]